MLKGEPRPYEVIALNVSQVAFLPRDIFIYLLNESHPFAIWLITILNERLAHYVSLVQNFRLGSTSARVAHSLLGLFNPTLFPNMNRRFPVAQEEVARLSGVSRQFVNRVLQELQDRGAIKIRYGSIEVLDLGILKLPASE